VEYEILITKKAVIDIKKLDSVVKKKIGKKILLLKKDPLKISKKLVNFKLGDYRYRIGDYRIIFEIRENRIYILKVGHRREIYC
jgi:mRNA interferase RelE/StbE